MPDDFDLDTGDLDRANRIAEEGRQRRLRRVKSDGDKSGGPSWTGPNDRDLTKQLGDAFDRIADQLLARDDDELATAIREERENMSTGLVALTRGLKPLRRPLVVVVSFLIPILAFWRVGGILARRAIARRQALVAEMNAQQPPPPVTPDPTDTTRFAVP